MEKNTKILEEIKNDIVKNDFDKAMKKLKNLDENDFGDKNYLMGVILANKKNFDKAEDYFQKTLEINNKHIGAYLSLSELYNIQEKSSKAKDVLEKAYEIDPDNINIIPYLAGLYMHLGDYQNAVTYLHKLNIDNQNDNITNLLLLALESLSNEKLEGGELYEAEELAKEMININDDYYGGYKMLGIINQKKNNKKEASENLIQAFKRVSDDINIANLLTYSLIELGDFENAKYANEKALIIDPNNRLAIDFKKQIINNMI